MNERDDGGPAFPRALPEIAVPPSEVLDLIARYEGMSLRDHFAAKALPECISVAADQTLGTSPMLSELFDKAAAYAYYTADAMLKARQA